MLAKSNIYKWIPEEGAGWKITNVRWGGRGRGLQGSINKQKTLWYGAFAGWHAGAEGRGGCVGHLCYMVQYWARVTALRSSLCDGVGFFLQLPQVWVNTSSKCIPTFPASVLGIGFGSSDTLTSEWTHQTIVLKHGAPTPIPMHCFIFHNRHVFELINGQRK